MHLLHLKPNLVGYSLERQAQSHSQDELLSKFWEVEETPKNCSMDSYSQEERLVVHHFKENHRKSKDGRFVVPLPCKPGAKALGESRTQAVRRFLSLEQSLRTKNQFKDFLDVIEEYFEMDHAELVPTDDMQKPSHQVSICQCTLYTRKAAPQQRFDASAKSSTGVSLNDTLMVGPTVHPPLIDVLIRFCQHRMLSQPMSARCIELLNWNPMIVISTDLYRGRIQMTLSKITE